MKIERILEANPFDYRHRKRSAVNGDEHLAETETTEAVVFHHEDPKNQQQRKEKEEEEQENSGGKNPPHQPPEISPLFRSKAPSAQGEQGDVQIVERVHLVA